MGRRHTGAAAGRSPPGRGFVRLAAEVSAQGGGSAGLLGIPDQEVEVTSLRGLQDVVEEQASIPPPVGRRGWGEGREPALDLPLGDVQRQAPRRDVQLYLVSGAHGPQGPTGRTLRGDVEDDSAIRRPAHAGVRDAHHVPYPLGQELLGDRQVAHLGHARGAILLAAALQQLEVVEYPPAEIKSAVAGTGRATKDQVGFMVRRLLSLREAPRPSDAADGVAVALCHCFRGFGPKPVPAMRFSLQLLEKQRRRA